MQLNHPEEFSAPRARWELLGFYVLTVTVTTVATALLWRLPENFGYGDLRAIRDAVNDVGAAIVAVPAAIALLVTLVSRGWRAVAALLRRLLILPPLYILLALLLTPAAQWIAFILWSTLFRGAVTPPDLLPTAASWLQASVAGAVILLGEEIGWRGFVLPRLLAYLSWRKAALICGLLWAGWHMPFWIPANFAATGSALSTAMVMIAATAQAIALSVIITWLFVRTRCSITVPALLHGANNAGMNIIYDMLDYRAAEPSWPVTYAVVLSVFAGLFLLPERRK